MFNPKNFAYILKYKIMIMISILKWQANPFLSYIYFSADSYQNVCRQGSVFGWKIESYLHILWTIHIQIKQQLGCSTHADTALGLSCSMCFLFDWNILVWFSQHLNLLLKNSLHLNTYYIQKS